MAKAPIKMQSDGSALQAAIAKARSLPGGHEFLSQFTLTDLFVLKQRGTLLMLKPAPRLLAFIRQAQSPVPSTASRVRS